MSWSQPKVLLEEYPWQDFKLAKTAAVYFCWLQTIKKNQHFTRFVYRLGQWVFSPLRGVRFPYRVPDLIALVTKPVGDSDSD